MIGKYAWDGKAKGTPPGLYNTVLVSPKSAGDMPPVWWQEAVFKGTVHVTKEPAERAKNGIVSLPDAVLAVAPRPIRTSWSMPARCCRCPMNGWWCSSAEDCFWRGC